MAVQNIECKLVQAQLNMIVAGEKFPGDVLEGVDDHLKACNECREVLFRKRSDLKRRLEAEALEAVPVRIGAPSVNLSGRTEVPTAYAPTHAAVMLPESELATTDAKPINWKPIAYSAGLAAVLVAMSWIARDPTRVFGEKAADTVVQFPAPPKVEVKAEPTNWIDKPAPKIVTPPEAVTKKPAASKPIEKTAPPVRRPVARKPAPQVRKSTPSGIRIYDANGKPIK